MYGIVNKAIQDLVSENYGLDTWTRVLIRSGVSADFFSSNEAYPDEMTYKLAAAAAAELDTPLEEILRSFGHYWVLRTGKEKYGALMEAGGANLKEFLSALPQFHNRILLMFPQLRPPEFAVRDLGAGHMEVDYISERAGLELFVVVLLEGPGELFATPVSVTQTRYRTHLQDHATFTVNWS